MALGRPHMAYKVLIMDCNEAVRVATARWRIWLEGDFELAAEAAGVGEALKLMENGRFDIVVADAGSQEADGLKLLESIRRRRHNVEVMLISAYRDFEYVRQGMRLGAFDYILKPLRERDFRRSLELAAKIISGKASTGAGPRISGKEIELWLHSIIAGEKTARELAEEIGDTVKSISGGNTDMQASLLNQTFGEFGAELYKAFPWLESLCAFDFTFSGDRLREKTEEAVEVLINTARSFKLDCQNSLINKICTITAEHIADAGVFDIVANELGFSRDYIGRVFKKHFNITYKKYVLDIKMEYAKRLLLDGEYKIYEVSDMLGYSTVDYFSRIFRRRMGMTPMEFRNKNLFG